MKNITAQRFAPPAPGPGVNASWPRHGPRPASTAPVAPHDFVEAPPALAVPLTARTLRLMREARIRSR